MLPWLACSLILRALQSQYSGVGSAAAVKPKSTKLAYAQLDLSNKAAFKIPTNAKYGPTTMLTLVMLITACHDSGPKARPRHTLSWISTRWKRWPAKAVLTILLVWLSKRLATGCWRLGGSYQLYSDPIHKPSVSSSESTMSTLLSSLSLASSWFNARASPDAE